MCFTFLQSRNTGRELLGRWGCSGKKTDGVPAAAEFIFGEKGTDSKQANTHMNETISHSDPFYEDSKGGCCVGGVGEA